MFGTLISLLSLCSRVGADHVQPWMFIDEPVAMISKAGIVQQRNRLFFVSGENCETDIIVWLSSENKKALETAEKQFVELKFDVLQDALSYTLTDTTHRAQVFYAATTEHFKRRNINHYLKT
jgi:hypothetical protein